jgi:hypothetical protein
MVDNRFRPRCESCRREHLKIVFRVSFDDGFMIDVCETCVPDPQATPRIQVLRVVDPEIEEVY